MLAAGLLASCSGGPAPFSSAPPSVHVGQVALDAGAPDIALSVAALHLAARPGAPDALLLRADALAAKGDAYAAGRDYAAVLQARPSSAEAALGLSRTLTPTDPAAAEVQLGAFVAMGGAPAAVWNNLGVARDLLGRHATAQDAYRLAIAADPAMASARTNLAHSLAEASRPQLAATTIATAAPCGMPADPPVGASPLDQAATRLGDWLHAPDRALGVAQARLHCDPGDLDLRARAVQAALAAGDGDAARQLAADALRLHPASIRSFVMAASVYQAQGDYRRALDALLTARRLRDGLGPAPS